jgi:RHS repeat-associated protein
VFDAADRLVEERWQPSATAAISHTIKRIYDAASQLIGVTETDTANPAATAAWQFAYDALGNVVKSRMAPGEIAQQPAFDGVPNPPGSLAAGDPTIDWDNDGKAERYDGYQITLAVGEQLLLTASSAAFDPVLLLQRPGQGLATALFDDHSGGGTTARLLVTADVAGTWFIAVTARDENASGAYALQIVKDQHAFVPTALVEYDYTYDKAGNLLSATEDQAAVANMYGFGPAASGLGVRTSYTLDALNRVTRYEQAATGQVTKRADYAYRGNGSFGSVTRFAGAGVNPIGTSTASYDGMGRTTGITHAPSASPSIAYAYAYDAANRMTSLTTPEGTSSFTLDATDQLLSASLTGEAYAYDKTGNRTSGGTQTGSGNRLAFDGTYRYAYDAEGNRTAKFLDTNAGGTLSLGDTDVTVYGYDQRNRLVAVSHVNVWTIAQAAGLAAFNATGTGIPGSDLELRYTYDYADRRIRKSLDADGTAGSGLASVSFAAYAGDVRTLEIARTASFPGGFLGQVIQRNFYGNGQDEILAVDQISWNGTTPTTSTYWTFTDHQDSVREIVSGNAADRGKVVEHRQYDSFGKVVRRTTGPAAGAPATSGVGIDFGYAGLPFENRTGLSDNRARWYEPGTGRFINEDPSGFTGGDVNLFRYVGNDPLNKVDPSGLTGIWANAVKPSVPAAAWGGFGWQTPITPAITPSTSAMAFASLRSQPVAATPTFSIPAPTLTVSTITGNVYTPVSTQTYSPSSSVAAEGGYLTRSVKSLVLGDWTDTNPTALSIGVGVGLGLVGADLPMDLRDLGHTVTHPEWSYDWGKRLAINTIAVLPIVGAIKYAKYLDDAAATGEKCTTITCCR